MGFEPTTLGTTIRYSNQLSYTHHLDLRLQKYYFFPKCGHFFPQIFHFFYFPTRNQGKIATFGGSKRHPSA